MTSLQDPVLQAPSSSSESASPTVVGISIGVSLALAVGAMIFMVWSCRRATKYDPDCEAAEAAQSPMSFLYTRQAATGMTPFFTVDRSQLQPTASASEKMDWDSASATSTNVDLQNNASERAESKEDGISEPAQAELPAAPLAVKAKNYNR
ncbi:hypothetical protein VHEMI05186 [[Torrubiella] hemipterigena]|uniref:Uncharacterized protein n=1 Tax=[Torrubiella] hemipterigena TaxID=1531966 RepID=A0A0A1TI31_9HYPO|nr:hypothetical protein VHEMI05186 [[Torrubiella] hemipterigena]